MTKIQKRNFWGWKHIPTNTKKSSGVKKTKPQARVQRQNVTTAKSYYVQMPKPNRNECKNNGEHTNLLPIQGARSAVYKNLKWAIPEKNPNREGGWGHS